MITTSQNHLYTYEQLKNCIICPGFSESNKMRNTPMFFSFFELKNKLSDNSIYTDHLLCYNNLDNCFIYSFNIKQEFQTSSSSRSLVAYLQRIDNKFKLKRLTYCLNGPKICLYYQRNNPSTNLFEINTIKQPNNLLTVNEFINVFHSYVNNDELTIKNELIKWFTNNYANSEAIDDDNDESKTDESINNKRNDESKTDERNDERYKQQLNFAYNQTVNDFNIETCFNAAVAIMTNTTIYQDLPLKEVEKFEDSINWENECDDEADEEFNKPFISHVNLETKTCISSFIATDEQQILKAYQGLTTMLDISKRYNYNYLIAMSEPIPRIMKLCQRLSISEQNVIIVDENAIKALYISSKHQIEAKQKANIEALNSSIYTLRDYQQEYIDWMNQNPRSILKLPCGMGKSLIMIYHMMTHRQLSVVLVPNIALVEQFYININKFYKGFNQPLPEVHRLSTRDKELAITDNTKQQIIISVYNSFVQLFIQPILTNRKNTDKSTILSFEHFPYIYIDEAHHVILPSNKKQKENATYLLNEYDKLTKLTKDSEYDEDENGFIEQINNLPNYGKTFSSLLYVFSYSYCDHSYYFSATINPSNFSKYNMFAAISAGYLCRLNIDLIIDENYNQSNIPPNVKINNLVDYIKKSSYQSIIIYTSRCITAKSICDTLEAEKMTAAVITAKMNSTERQANFDKFRNHELRILLTVNCISEGVDLPNADTAIFFDEKRSIINIIQCVGRVMRLSEGKLSARLVIPAYNDDDIDNLYKNILTVINGELGYGNIDIRRILSVKFNGKTRSKIQNVKQYVKCKIYEYNEEYFSKISVWNKIRRCAYFYNQTHIIPTLNMTGPQAYMADGNYFDLQQFVHDNLYNDNLAGRELRKIYGI